MDIKDISKQFSMNNHEPDKVFLQTRRLLLRPLVQDDANFIMALLNSPDWIRFIGDRNVRTHDDADSYIAMVRKNPKLQYWVVMRCEDSRPLGIITLIEREYLPGPDLGFAFLPEYSGRGYALEASAAIIEQRSGDLTSLYAVTISANEPSVKLLKRLEFTYLKTLPHEPETLEVYVRHF